MAFLNPAAIKLTPINSNTRIFNLVVNPSIFHSKPSTNKGINSLQISKGTYFYMSKNYRIDNARQAQINVANKMARDIQALILVEVKYLQKFWYNTVNKYFNRRVAAYSAWINGSWVGYNRLKHRKPHPSNKPSSKYNTTRQHTGQLRRSLKQGSVTPFGAMLYVARVYAKTNNRDYVEILIRGAKAGPRAYVPKLDFRVKHGKWKGIPKTRWAAWQRVFVLEIRKAEQRLNKKIDAYILNMGILNKSELAAVRAGRTGSPKYTKEIEQTEANWLKEFNGKGYKAREEVIKAYAEESLWHGEKGPKARFIRSVR